MMGIQRIRAFASLMLLASVNDSKPRELLAVALTRAKMCELLAEKVGERRKDRPFTVGLLSVLDALLDMPMQQVIESLPLTNEMNDALLHRHGLLGDLLNMVLQYESGEPPHANSQSEVQLASSDLADAYYEAVQWATECADRAV